MIKLINRLTGGPMWVHESRVEEYLAKGHILAPPPKPAHPLIKAEDEPAPAKKPAKKTVKAR